MTHNNRVNASLSAVTARANRSTRPARGRARYAVRYADFR